MLDLAQPDTVQHGETTSPAILHGVRIADFSWHGVGPYCTMLLAQMGAEVIRVESATHLDIHRRAHPVYGRMDVSPYEQLLALKKSVTINMKAPGAVELAKRLILESDVVVENFRPGVMDRLGLGYEALRQLKPDVIMVSCSAAGQTGPEREYGGFAPIFSALGGLGHLTGYVDGPPVELRNQMDHVSGMVACFAVMAALVHHQRTGEGQFIDVASREVATWFMGEVILDYTMNGRIGSRRGNRDSAMAPHNVYPCAGQDRWVSIAAGTDEEWRALCTVMGRSDLATDARFADAFARIQNEDELDRLIADWTRECDALDVTERLQAAGVAAMPSMNGADLVQDPHLQARNAFPEMVGLTGWRRPTSGKPWIFSATPGGVHTWPPELGEHNREIFCGLLGLTEAQFERLQTEQVIY